MKIDINSIKQLRAKTGAGVSDCKKALEECNGDIDMALDKLRVIGLAKASKKSDRVASDGLIAMHIMENKGTLIELNCETDFVARTKSFVMLASRVAILACEASAGADLYSMQYGESSTVREAIMSDGAAFGEKLAIGRICYIENKHGVIAGYVHGGPFDASLNKTLGKMGALVALESSGEKTKLQEIARDIAMHIVAMKPEALSINDLDQEKLDRERTVIAEQVKSLNKPEELTKKIIDGRMAKYYEEVVLLEQRFIKDESMSVSEFIKFNESIVHSQIKLLEYKLLVLGDTN